MNVPGSVVAAHRRGTCGFLRAGATCDEGEPDDRSPRRMKLSNGVIGHGMPSFLVVAATRVFRLTDRRE